MVKEDFTLYFKDILKCIRKIKLYVNKVDFQFFVSDEKTYDAVVRNLEIIGEASNEIPNYIKAENKSIEWRKISGFRNILIHNYSGIDDEIVWDVIKNKLPKLEKEIRILLRSNK
jgi:uncharacterized protein with HEPN domain